MSMVIFKVMASSVYREVRADNSDGDVKDINDHAVTACFV